MNIKMTHSGLVSKIPQLIGFAEVSSESHNRPEATSPGAFSVLLARNEDLGEEGWFLPVSI